MAKAPFGVRRAGRVHTGQFYALYYLQTVLKIHFMTANFIVAVALLLATPFFILFGGLSDKVGRKKLIMLGCLLAAFSYYPIYFGMTYFATDPQNPNAVMLSVLVFIQVIFVTMVYGRSPFSCRIVPDTDPLYFHVPSLSYQERNLRLVPLIGTAIVIKTENMPA
jgi:MFS family permease